MRLKKRTHQAYIPAKRAARGVRRPEATALRLEALEERLALSTLLSGFRETLVTTNSNLSGPTAMEFSPTSELFVLEQSGRVKLIRGDGSAHTALTLTVDSAGERGLLGIAFDPGYDGTGPNADFVYLYYTTPRTSDTDPANNRLSQFTVTGAGTLTPTLGGEVVRRELPPEDEDDNPATNGDTNHNGGAIHFGPDGKLYVAVGDHNYDTTPQSAHVSQILTSPFGKILRLNTDGSNPTDNPFYNGSATNAQGAVWALGLRNPYTFAFQPGTGRMFINDVGEGQWEEINDGEASANYGWAGSTSPLWEGFESPPPTWANYRDPVMAFDHSNSLPSPAGIAITGGVFYPSGGILGSAYAGKYFFADFGGNFIRVFDPANPGSVSTPDTSAAFASSLTNGSPVDLKVDAAGNLYYLARSGGEIYRISLTEVVGRQLFYNESGTSGATVQYDGKDPAINSLDDNAIAADKTAYLPGSGKATFASISSYSKGINGIMVDIAGAHGTISADDFIFRMGNNNSPGSWATAPAPSSVSVRAGAGTSGGDRVEITWANGVISKTWLQVITLANADTGLAQDPGLPAGQADVFFFGNALGNSGRGDTAILATVDITDQLQARNNPATLPSNVPITNIRDYNRDAIVDITDELIARGNTTNFKTATRFLNIAGPPGAPEGMADEFGGEAAVALALSVPQANVPERPALRWLADTLASAEARYDVVSRRSTHLAEAGAQRAKFASAKSENIVDALDLEEPGFDELLADIAVRRR